MSKSCQHFPRWLNSVPHIPATGQHPSWNRPVTQHLPLNHLYLRPTSLIKSPQILTDREMSWGFQIPDPNCLCPFGHWTFDYERPWWAILRRTGQFSLPHPWNIRFFQFSSDSSSESMKLSKLSVILMKTLQSSSLNRKKKCILCNLIF